MRYFVNSSVLFFSIVGTVCLTLLVSSPLRANAQAAAEPATESPTAAPETETAPSAESSSQPSLTASEYVRQGDSQYAAADYEDAIASYTESLKLFNQNAYAYYNRGNAYRQQGQYLEALTDYNRSLQLNPDNTFGYLYRGMVLKELGEYQVAVGNYTEFLKRGDPKNPLPYEVRGEAYHLLGDKQAALKDLKKALDLYRRSGKYRQQNRVEKTIRQVSSSRPSKP